MYTNMDSLLIITNLIPLQNMLSMQNLVHLRVVIKYSLQKRPMIIVTLDKNKKKEFNRKKI